MVITVTAGHGDGVADDIGVVRRGDRLQAHRQGVDPVGAGAGGVMAGHGQGIVTKDRPQTRRRHGHRQVVAAGAAPHGQGIGAGRRFPVGADIGPVRPGGRQVQGQVVGIGAAGHRYLVIDVEDVVTAALHRQ